MSHQAERPVRLTGNPNRSNSRTAISDVVHDMCRYIETHTDEPLTLAAMAKKSGYSAAHLQRSFRSIVGSSPKAYHLALRNRQFKRSLKLKQRLGDAIDGAGDGSQSRVYEKLSTTFGMTPRQYREGGSGLQIRYAISNTRLGWMLIGATERGICVLQFGNNSVALTHALQSEFQNAALRPMEKARDEEFTAWMRSLDAYLAGQIRTLDLPLDIRGTAFQMLVWNYLRTIPAGDVQSYSAVANAIGKPAAVRAIASACAKNRIAIAIPCHRVIRGNGEPAGYRWSPGRKRMLLDLERKTAST